MSSDYNGWKNYQTWNIVLWINNDEGISDMIDGNLFKWLRREVLIALEFPEEQVPDIQEHFVNSVSFGALREIMATDETFPMGVTPDGVRLDDPAISWEEIRSAIAERLDSRTVNDLCEYFNEMSNTPRIVY